MEATQALATRYFSSQFWCEFTKEVLLEFVHEDFYIKDVIVEKKKKELRERRL